MASERGVLDLKIRYLAERKKGAELQQCLRQMKEEQIYLSSKSKEVLAFGWIKIIENISV